MNKWKENLIVERITHSGWEQLSDKEQRLLESIYYGYNYPPHGLEEIDQQTFFHVLSQTVPIMSFSLFVTRDEQGNPVKDHKHLTCYLFEPGHGIAFEFKWHEHKTVFYRFGCHHKWDELSIEDRKAIEILDTWAGHHVYKCRNCEYIYQTFSV